MLLSESSRQWLVREYPSKGPRHCAQKLGLHKRTVDKYAQKLGLSYGESSEVRRGRWLLLTEVALEAGAHKTYTKRRAVAAGMTKRVGNYLIIKASWAKEFIAEQQELAEKARQYAHYWRTPKAANYLGISQEHLTRTLQAESGGYLKEKLKHVHYVKIKRGHILINPHDIDTARRAIEADREQAQQMVSMKSLYVELDIPAATVYRWVYKLTEPHIASVGGHTLLFVSPDVADAIRDRARQ